MQALPDCVLQQQASTKLLNLNLSRLKRGSYVMTPAEILQFWFEDIDRSLWFKKDADFDQLLREYFGAIKLRVEAEPIS